MTPNWRRGFLRLTWVLSIIFALLFGAHINSSEEDFGAAIVASVLAFGLTWVLYFSGKFVASGFFKNEATHIPTDTSQTEINIESTSKSPEVLVKSLNNIPLLSVTIVFQVILSFLLIPAVKTLEIRELSLGGVVLGLGAIFSSAIMYSKNKEVYSEEHAISMLKKSGIIGFISIFPYMWVASIYHQTSQYYYGLGGMLKIFITAGVCLLIVVISVAMGVAGILIM